MDRRTPAEALDAVKPRAEKSQHAVSDAAKRQREKRKAVERPPGVETMGDRIVALIDAYNRRRPPTERKLNPQRLSLTVSENKNPGVIRELLRRERAGEYAAGIDAERLLRIARFFGVTAAYLRTGRDDMDALNVTSSPFGVAGTAGGVGQPVISVTGGMGGGGIAGETTTVIGGVTYAADAVRGEVVIPDFMLSSMSHNARRDGVHWFDVAGDSMEPTLHAGDWVGVNVKDKQISQGGVFALRDQHGTILVKRLETGNAPGRIDIISDNPRQPAKSELMGDITVIGRVIAKFTRVG
ncbi:S24 family peptidase [Bradyrhizobium sp. USDA 4350]